MFKLNLIGLLISVMSLTAVGTLAQEISPAKQAITTILASPEFETHRKEPRLKYLGEKSTKFATESFHFNNFSIELIASLLEVLLWCVLAIAIISFAFRGRKWLGGWHFAKPRQTDVTSPPQWRTKNPQDSTHPDHLPEHAWQLWQAGQRAQALSLLYRGALMVLTTRDKLTVPASATEGDCLRLIQYSQSAELRAYFSELTRYWQATAYAQCFPADETVHSLCDKWAHYFESSTMNS